MRSPWDCLLENLGEWRGSFARVSPEGAWLEETPSIVSLESDDGKTVRQRIRRFSPAPGGGLPSDPAAAPLQDTTLTFGSLGRSFAALDGGAFSQGSMQLAPFAEFGAELGLMARPRRVRVVLRYDKTGRLQPLTLIRERLSAADPTAPLSPARTPADLLAALEGTWEGEAVTAFPDLRPAETMATELTVTRRGDRLSQSLSFGAGDATRTIASEARIDGDRLRFEDGPNPVQVLLLPDGVSANGPLAAKLRSPFVLEAGWLVASDRRQRLVRRYSASGEWVGLTLVTERRRP